MLQLEEIVTKRILDTPITPIVCDISGVEFLYDSLTQRRNANVLDLGSAKKELDALSLSEKIRVYSTIRKTATAFQAEGVNGDAWYYFAIARFFLKEFMVLNGDKLAEEMDIQVDSNHKLEHHQIFGLYDRAGLKAAYVVTEQSLIRISKD